jgi:hypothetical protein
LIWRVVRYAVGFPVWGDEAFLAINLYERSLAGLASPLEYWQVAPWGFLAAESGMTRLLGRSEWALRLLPSLSGAAALVLLARFSARILDRRSAMLAVGLLAASYFPVRHAAEIKPYSVDLLIGLALMVLGWGVRESPRSWRLWPALIAAAGLGVWFSFPAVFVAGSVGLLLTERAGRDRHPRVLVPWAVYGLVLAASWVAMVVLYAGPQARAAWPTQSTGAWDNAYPPIGRPWRLPWWLLEVHAGYMMAYPVGGSGFCSIFTLLYATIGAVALWRARRRALLALLLGPLPLNFAAAALKRYPYGTSPRVALYMAPAFCLLTAVGLAWSVRRLIPRRLVPAALLVIAGLLGLGPLVGAGIDLARPYRQRDDLAHRQVIRTLAAQAAPGDRWLIFNGMPTRPATPTIMLAPWLQQEAECRFYWLQTSPASLRWVYDPTDPELTTPRTPGRTWLIVHRTGMPFFPQNVADAIGRLLAARFGPPRTVTAVITEYESITAQVFPAPGETPEVR